MKLSRILPRLKVLTQLRHYPKYKWGKNIDIENPPCYIVGSPHSGTSILLAILDAHSKIYGVPYETQMFMRPLKQYWMPKYFDLLAISNGKTRWIEKTPMHIEYISNIFSLNKKSKVILIIRDGRDVASSIQKRSCSITVGIDRWMDDNKLGQQYWDHPNVHVLRYENIITDFVDTISSVLEFMGESYEDNCKNYNQKDRRYYASKIEKPENASGKNHRQHRNWQINQPLFDGRGRWKTLNQDEKNIINEAAAEMLKEYGYIEDKNW